MRICFIKTRVGNAGPDISLDLLFKGLTGKSIRIWLLELDLDAQTWSFGEYGSNKPLCTSRLPHRWSRSFQLKLVDTISGFIRTFDIEAIDGLYNKRCVPLYLLLIERLRNIPFILHLYVDINYGSGNINTPRTPRELRQVRSLLRSVDAGVAISRYIVRDVAAACGPVARRKISLIPDAVERPAGGGKAGRKTGLSGHPSILFLGRLERSKGLDVLLFAFHDLVRLFPGARLSLVGSGRLRKQLENLAAALGTRENITFTDWVSYDRVPRLIRECTFLVLPSLDEPFGRPVIEAMAWGKPVVASRVGGIPEMIRHNRNGILVAPGAQNLFRAMRRLCEDRGLRARMGGRNRADAKQYYLERVARAHIDLYEKQISHHSL
jgi:glycosyltransferase involved in cell wall biosynthesis